MVTRSGSFFFVFFFFNTRLRIGNDIRWRMKIGRIFVTVFLILFPKGFRVLEGLPKVNIFRDRAKEKNYKLGSCFDLLMPKLKLSRFDQTFCANFKIGTATRINNFHFNFVLRSRNNFIFTIKPSHRRRRVQLLYCISFFF